MSEAHLSNAAIERYIARRAPVDEILAAAEHLDGCFECRDRAAALVDDGAADIPHVRKRIPTAADQTRLSALPWIAVAALLLIALLLIVLLRE